jgi:cytidylate kinase
VDKKEDHMERTMLYQFRSFEKRDIWLKNIPIRSLSEKDRYSALYTWKIHNLTVFGVLLSKYEAPLIEVFESTIIEIKEKEGTVYLEEIDIPFSADCILLHEHLNL